MYGKILVSFYAIILYLNKKLMIIKLYSGRSEPRLKMMGCTMYIADNLFFNSYITWNAKHSKHSFDCIETSL